MNEAIQKLLNQIQQLPRGQLAALLLTASGSLLFFGWLTLSEAHVDERLLFRGLEEAEASRVVQELVAQKISYRLDDGGTSIFVPAPQVYEARIRLAGQGLPSGGGPGFEIFDKGGFGLPDFVNRVNYQRALQGELARSIEQLGPVERARVQLAIPERRFASGRGQPASASVVVRLRGGANLEPEQARGIVHLVASSVEGLDAARVTLIDDRGQLLSAGHETGAAAATSGAMAHQTKLESELAARIQSILEPTVGTGRVVARVRSELDWTERESNEERFDPESQVARSEEVRKEEETETTRAADVSVTGSDQVAAAGPGTHSASSTETTSYEISKVVNRVTSPAGNIRRLDVAVLVDGVPSADGAYVAWDAEALSKFEQLAKRAIGFSEERGDKIVVTSAAFRPIALEEPAGWLTPELWILISNLLRVVGILGALVLFARLIVKPLAERLPKAPPAAPQAPIRAEDLANQLAQGGAAPNSLEFLLDGANRGQNVAALAAASSDDAMRALRTWLSER